MPRQSPVHRTSGPGGRALAPDLARGSMLLFIALANTVWYLWAAPGSGVGSAHPPPEGLLDRATQFFMIVAVDMRSYPMFAFLFGYGMVQLLQRQEASGASPGAVDALLRRRNLWLLVFGLVHALLLFGGDILGAYGMVGLLSGWLFLRRAERTLRIWVWALLGLLALISLSGLAALAFVPVGELTAQGGADPLGPMMKTLSESSYPLSVLWRISVWPVLVFSQGLLSLVVPVAVLLGFLAARHRVLEEPEHHLGLLRTTAVAGIAVGWLGGLPLALAQIGGVELNEAQAGLLLYPNMLAGLFCGVGYVCLIALIARRVQERGMGPVARAVSATGKRSLSAYLAQSVLSAPVLAAWGLGLGAYLQPWSAVVVAAGVWLSTVLGATALERTGRRGPAEVLLRRLAYRSPVQRGPGAPPVPTPGGGGSGRPLSPPSKSPEP